MKHLLRVTISVSAFLVMGLIIMGFSGRACAQDKKSPQTVFMEKLKVVGKLERPEAVYIINVTNPEFKPLHIDRSFHDEMIEPLDKDEFEAGFKPKERTDK
jgi:hypothetical protein